MRRFWPLLALAAALGLLFGPALAQGLLLAPGDGLAQYFPERVIAGLTWRSGEIPFWNPYLFGGMPLLAAMQAGVMFPGNAAFLWLPPVAAMNMTVLAAFGVAGAGAYALARSQALGRLAALASGLVFMLSGFLIAHLEHVVVVQVAGLLPWLLWAIERRAASGHKRFAMLAAALVGLMLLAGHPQTALFGLGLALAFALWRGWTLAPAERPAFAGAGLLAGGLGLALALPQLLPAAALSAESGRAHLDYGLLVESSLAPLQLVTGWFPFFFGGTPSGWFPVRYWGGAPWPNEVTGYAGLGTWLLVVAALAGFKGPVRFWSGVALLGLLLALGGHTPLYQLWHHVPLLNTMRAPGRHLMEVNLALAMLAGFGCQQLAACAPARRRRLAGRGALAILIPLTAVAAFAWVAGDRWLAHVQPYVPHQVIGALRLSQPALWVPLALGLAFVAAALALAGARARTYQAALVGLLGLDLLLFASHQGWAAASPSGGAVPPLTQPTFSASRSLPLPATPYPYVDVARATALRAPAWGALWGERSASGYDPLFSARYGRLLGGMTHGGVGMAPAIFGPAHHALDVLNTTTIRLEPGAGADLPGDRWRSIAHEAGLVLFENTRALPPAWRVRAAEALSAEGIEQRLTADANFEPAQLALLEAPLAQAPLAPGPVSIVARTLNRIELETEGAGPGLVVVSEAFDAGWSARVNGTAAPVQRADGLVMAVEVPAGHHRISMRYEPPGWRVGLVAAILALLALAVWAAWRPRQRAASERPAAMAGRSMP